MADCLGLYIQKHLIKYAKVFSDGSKIKVITTGVKPYSNVREAINQIIQETDSYRTPISVNATGEKYEYFYLSSLLNKRDLEKSIKTEFEISKAESGENPNALETRYAIVSDPYDRNRIKVIHMAEDKIKINQIENLFKEARLTNLTPISFSIANIAPIKDKSNIAVVNIEDETAITTITGQNVYEIEKIKAGANKYLEEIAGMENSYAKAYEICKNTTIFTMDQANSQEDGHYLSRIIPSLYEIATKVRDIVRDNDIKKVYLTGNGAIINNVDLYFNEIIGQDICEVLKPFFLSENAQVNIKDYIEANSAIALALQGLGFGIKNINFAKNSGFNLSSISIGKGSSGGSKKPSGIDLDASVTKGIKYAFIISLAFFIIYSGFSLYTAREIRIKKEKIGERLDYTTAQIKKADQDTAKLQTKSIEYEDLITRLKNAKETVGEKTEHKYSIPNLLSHILQIIPKEVQLLSIENPSGKKIVIVAQSLKYEQLAYFKAKLKQEDEILDPESITSTQAVKSGDDSLKSKNQSTYLEKMTVQVVIEGELR